MGRSPARLSRCSETSVRLTGRRPADPWKITSSILPPRSSRADCSPSPQRPASDTLDLPQPWGPTIAVTPSSNSRVTVSAKDLKPESSSLVSFMPLARDGEQGRRGAPADSIQNKRAASSGQGRRGGNRRTKYRSEEHTSELQSRLHLVCRLLLEKKKKN